VIRVSVNKATRGQGFITLRRTRQGRDPELLRTKAAGIERSIARGVNVRLQW